MSTSLTMPVPEMNVLDVGVHKTRVSEVPFADLYLSESGRAMFKETTQGPLITLPAQFMQDVDKLLAKTEVAARSKRGFGVEHDAVRYRGSTIHSANRMDGKTFVLRRLKEKVPLLEDMEWPLSIMRAIMFLGSRHPDARKGGLFLVVGPTGAGKSTTLWSILQQMLMTFGGVARTIEDPIEYMMEKEYPPGGYCWQTEVVDGNFADPLFDVLRHGPRYIMFGEIRDHATAATLIGAAQTGHIVLSTMHAKDVTEGLSKLLLFASRELGVETARQNIALSMAAVISQNLGIRLVGDVPTPFPILHEALFFPKSNDGQNQVIRAGNLHQITTYIENQMDRVRSGQDPIEMPKPKPRPRVIAGRG